MNLLKLAVWLCDCVAVLLFFLCALCGPVALRPCVTLCRLVVFGLVAVCLCGCGWVDLRLCGCLFVLMCGFVAVLLCGCDAVLLCGPMAVWLYGCMTV